MGKLHCILCDHETSDPEIITHINTFHNGLNAYFKLFPSVHVVSEDLMAAIAGKYLSPSADIKCILDSLSDDDKVLVATYHTLGLPVRSEIIISEE